MSNIPADLKYVASHEWLKLEDDGIITVGITDHAQDLLGDVVFVELPEVGREVSADEAASDVYAPIAGEIVEINDELVDSPELANEDPYGKAWFFKIKPANVADYDDLLSAEEYQSAL